ncbi:MAG TPA: CoA transferase, partial [Candidatus Limnocylindria bacterium]|nr:CoA transferase [Candidatus Limnocylindria bacterium]
GFMISEFHEHFIGIEIGNKPVPVADGFFTLRIPDLSDGNWAKLAKLMDREDLIQDQRFATAPARKLHRAELYELIRSWIRGKSRQELWDGLRAIDYFGAPVLSMGEVLEDPHIKERQAFIQRNHSTAGPVTLLAPWIHMSKTPPTIREDSPALGQHTSEVLGGVLGLGTAELDHLRSQGVVK